MTSVTFCACCGAGMLHVEAETCSSFCRSEQALRRAQMVSSAAMLARAERAVPPAEYKMQAYGVSGPIDNYRDLSFDEYQPSGPVFYEMVSDDAVVFVNCYFGTDIGIPPHDVPAYELDQPEQYDHAPAVVFWTMGAAFITLGMLLIWAFS